MEVLQPWMQKELVRDSANLITWILETFIKAELELFDCTIAKETPSLKNRKTNFLGNLSVYYSYLSKTKVKYFIDKGN